MDIDDESVVFRKPTTPKPLDFSSKLTESPLQQAARRMTSFSQMNTPVRNTSSLRRGSSGFYYQNYFGGYFRHLKKLHMESMEGLNAVRVPPARAVFRSSLPATPIATPIYGHGFPMFSQEQLIERLCQTRTPSPLRKNHLDRREHNSGSRQSNYGMDVDGAAGGDQQPMDMEQDCIVEEQEGPASMGGSNSSLNPQPRREDIGNFGLNSVYYKINDQFNPD